jgi:hypothetical protein
LESGCGIQSLSVVLTLKRDFGTDVDRIAETTIQLLLRYKHIARDAKAKRNEPK